MDSGPWVREWSVTLVDSTRRQLLLSCDWPEATVYALAILQVQPVGRLLPQLSKEPLKIKNMLQNRIGQYHIKLIVLKLRRVSIICY